MQSALRRFNETRKRADATAPALSMRIGVNTGDVVAASGAAEGRDFLVTGDPVNVASRLQQIAAPGSVLVGPRTYRGSTGAVEYRALAPVALRGKPRPVRVWEALAVNDSGSAPMPRPRGVTGLYAPLVGRDAELDLLRSIYARVTNERRPHLVTILGAPGVGKSRLTREFLESITATAETEDAPVPLVLEGRCPPYGEGITYWPLAEMLRTHCMFDALESPEAARSRLLDCVREAFSQAGRTDDAEQVAAYLGHTIGIETRERRRALLPADAQHYQEGVLRSWRVFFEALAATRPVLVVVDDIHWADETLLNLLEEVASRASGVPLLLLCPARPELMEKRPDWGGGKRNYAIIGLEALSARDSQRLIRELLPDEGVPDSLRWGIIGKAEGNPFYVEEIVRMLVDRGILIGGEAAGRGWRVAPEAENSEEIRDLAIPDTVQGVLAARLDLLSEDERDLMQHAAVIGRYFWPAALRALHPRHDDADLDVILRALMKKDLIREIERPQTLAAPASETVYTFNHSLTREVTYAGIARTRRAHEHQHVAEWLEGLAQGRESEFADLLAQHYRQYYIQANLARASNTARRQAVRDKVVQYLGMAGDQAAARHSGVKAESYYTDALELLTEDSTAEDVPLRVELLMKRGEARWLQTNGDTAWADYRDALRLWSAYSTFMLEDNAASSVAATHAGDARVAATSGASIPIPTAGSPAVEDDAQQREPARPALPMNWRTVGLRLYHALVQLPTRYPSLFPQPPTHEELLRYLREGLQLSRELGQADTLEGAALLTAKAFFWWSWPEQRGENELMDALRGAREAVRITEALDDPRSASEALDALGSLQSATTDLRGNLESQTRRLQWARRLDDPAELVDIDATVCSAYMLVGDFALAIEHGQRALGLAESADAEALQAQALRNLAIAYFEWDRWPDTLRMCDRLQTSAPRLTLTYSDSHRWALLCWAIVLARTGDRDGSDRVARRVSEMPERSEAQFLGLVKARLAIARGALKEARQMLIASLDSRAGRMALPLVLSELAELGARTGERELYDRFAAQALELGWRSGARKALSQATRARGIIAVADGRWDDALADLENARTRYRDLGTAWEEARTLYALAGLYRRRGSAGDEDLARRELNGALTLFESLKSVRDIARAKAALAGGDVRLP
jgi:tetratricopeptide (TPR) repeat protein